MGTGSTVPNTMAFGGYLPTPAVTANTELYDGSSWTEVANLNTARSDGGGSGTQSGALCVGGEPPRTDAVEEWTAASVTAGTVTSS